jgi:hypothetical protein
MSQAPRKLRSPRWPFVAALSATVACGVTLLSTHAGADAPSPKARPVLAASQVPAGDPELAAFVQAAKRAGDRGDPLIRCLGFPDYPGNAWPAGLAAEHCHLLFDPVPSLSEVAAALETGDLAGLDARYAGLLDRHFDPAVPAENIHTALARFDGSADSDAVSLHWLELAPESAWANAARASHLHALAQVALGDGLEPTADRAAGEVQAASAMALYQQALALEPRLLPAHAALADLALRLGDETGADAAIAAGEAHDPACLALARAHLARLGPRHGGTYEHMQAYLRGLREANPQRLLLALASADEPLERGRALLKHGRFGEAQRELSPALLATTSPEAFEESAIAAVRAESTDQDAALALLVASSRYRPGPTIARELRGRLLIAAGERTWAMSILNAAGEGAPVGPLFAQSEQRAGERAAR